MGFSDPGAADPPLQTTSTCVTLTIAVTSTMPCYRPCSPKAEPQTRTVASIGGGSHGMPVSSRSPGSWPRQPLRRQAHLSRIPAPCRSEDRGCGDYPCKPHLAVLASAYRPRQWMPAGQIIPEITAHRHAHRIGLDTHRGLFQTSRGG